MTEAAWATVTEVAWAFLNAAFIAWAIYQVLKSASELDKARVKLDHSERDLSISQTARRILRQELDDAQRRCAYEAAHRYTAEERVRQLENPPDEGVVVEVDQAHDATQVARRRAT